MSKDRRTPGQRRGGCPTDTRPTTEQRQRESRRATTRSQAAFFFSPEGGDDHGGRQHIHPDRKPAAARRRRAGHRGRRPQGHQQHREGREGPGPRLDSAGGHGSLQHQEGRDRAIQFGQAEEDGGHYPHHGRDHRGAHPRLQGPAPDPCALRHDTQGPAGWQELHPEGADPQGQQEGHRPLQEHPHQGRALLAAVSLDPHGDRQHQSRRARAGSHSSA